jgi:acetolactate synthase-1/2/3 large subunit
MWTAQYYSFHKNDKFVTSGGMGTMGYGFGAAIGAKCGKPDQRVVHVTGDGSFRMNMNEMVTTCRYNLPVITVLMDNNTLGMVRQWQTMFHDARHSETTLPKVNFCKVAEGFGYKFTAKVDSVEAFEEAFKKALKNDGPSLIQCVIDIDTMVLPMVPPGKPIDQIMMTRT